MSTLEKIKRLEEEVKNIDKAILQRRYELSRSPLDHSKRKEIMNLQEMAGNKEKEITKLKGLVDMPWKELHATRNLLDDMMELFEGEHKAVVGNIKSIKESVDKEYNLILEEYNRRRG